MRTGEDRGGDSLRSRSLRKETAKNKGKGNEGRREGPGEQKTRLLAWKGTIARLGMGASGTRGPHPHVNTLAPSGSPLACIPAF